ncbi:HEPN domain-containing protein [Leadbetterella sp. DM7]|uniref:HEPN domain-containing protein n=1 Tax=Leadbetterella sp. DM7 TaxID=3235085 RepID=UPI00349ECCD2
MEIHTLKYEIKNPLLEKSHLILKECIITLNSLLKIHDEVKDEVKEKQDLLRAMFVFSSGGLDSLIKQAIKDVLPEIIEVNIGAAKMFTQYVERDIQSEKKGDIGLINPKLLAQLLTSQNPREELKRRLVYELTSNSLQSKDQILKIVSYFDIPSKNIVNDFSKLNSIFIERNKIIHEMDINFEGDQSRNERNKNEILSYINELLKVGEKFIKEVDARLIMHY